MADKVLDCSRFPSETGCTLRIAGRELEVLDAAVAHAVSAHGHEDTPELRSQLQADLADVEQPGFVQLIEFRADDIAAFEPIEDQWAAATEGRRRTIRSITCEDRADPGRYVVVVEFPSEAAARENEALPETAHFAEQVFKIVTEGPAFRDLDVVRIGV